MGRHVDTTAGSFRLFLRRRCVVFVELFEPVDDVAVLVEFQFGLPVSGVDLTQSAIVLRRQAAEQRVTFQDLSPHTAPTTTFYTVIDIRISTDIVASFPYFNGTAVSDVPYTFVSVNRRNN